MSQMKKTDLSNISKKTASKTRAQKKDSIISGIWLRICLHLHIIIKCENQKLYILYDINFRKSSESRDP